MAINYPGQTPHLAALHLDNGKLDHLTDIKGAALFYVSSVTYDEKNDRIFFTTDNDAWRDLNVYEIKTGRVKRLQKDFRTGDLTFNKTDESIWGIKHLNGFSTIVRIPRYGTDHPQQEYATWQQLYTLPYGHDIFDIDLSPDGKILSAAVSVYRGNQSLLFFNADSLMAKKVVIDTIFNFEVSSPQSFRFTPDGQYLYGSSHYSGVSNIYRVNVRTKEIVPISNAITGLFRPLLLDSERLLAFQFTADGFQPVLIPNKTVENVPAIDFLGNRTFEKYLVLRNWELPMASANRINLDSLKVREGRYRPGREIRLNAAYPVMMGYKNFYGIGYALHFSDPLNFREFQFSASYTPVNWVNPLGNERDTLNNIMEKSEQIHLSLTGKIGRYTFSVLHNPASFYDLFGPTKFSRRGTWLRVDYTRPLIWDLPRKLDLTVGSGAFYGLQKSPYFQQIDTQDFTDSLFVNFDATLSYSNMRSSLGAVDPEKGFRWTVRPMMATTGGQTFATVVGSYDFGIQLPVNHFSIWFRTAAGSSLSRAGLLIRLPDLALPPSAIILSTIRLQGVIGIYFPSPA